MSEPKRYFLKMSHTFNGVRCDTYEHKDGEYVLHDDYARLKAECQARQAENSVLAIECDSLKAEVEVWKGMVADSGVACNERAKENQDLENQNARLKAEVERLNKLVLDNLNASKTVLGSNYALEQERDSLKAEVEKLTADIQGRDATIMGYESVIKCRDEEIQRLEATWPRDPHHGGKVYDFSLTKVSELEAQVERLTKAGDAMMGWIDRQHDNSGYPFSEAWEAAKQGGQP